MFFAYSDPRPNQPLPRRSKRVVQVNLLFRSQILLSVMTYLE